MSVQQDSLRASHLVDTDWLAPHLANRSVRIVDMRGAVVTATDDAGFQSATYLGSRSEYDAGHIPGAVYLDWTKDIVDLSDPVPAQVAGPEQIARVLGNAG